MMSKTRDPDQYHVGPWGLGTHRKDPDCWCRPTLEQEPGVDRWVHHVGPRDPVIAGHGHRARDMDGAGFFVSAPVALTLVASIAWGGLWWVALAVAVVFFVASAVW